MEITAATEAAEPSATEAAELSATEPVEPSAAETASAIAVTQKAIQQPSDWQVQRSLKNDPHERDNLLSVVGHYSEIVQHGHQVKQWIDDYWTKPTIATITQFALFKCMHSKCIFSTDNVVDMALHMDSHLTLIDVMKCQNGQLDKRIRDEQIKFRDCSYCDLEANFNNELLAHLVEEHSPSIFQCAHCFYRSIEVDNIILHYESFHAAEKPEILLCGDVLEFGQQDNELLRDECEKNIDKIKCGQSKTDSLSFRKNIYFLFLEKIFF